MKKVKLITHLGISGDLDLDIPERTVFKLSPYKLSSGLTVGEFEVTDAQLKEIQKLNHWKMTYIQLRDGNKGESEKANASNQVAVGTVINPLGFSSQQVQMIENALLVKPAARELLADNVLDVCVKILDAENLPPKKDKKAPKSKAKATGKGKGKTAGKSTLPEVAPTDAEILEMDEAKLKSTFKAYGWEDKYDPDEDIVTNQNELMDLLVSNQIDKN